jgi:magnesium transporter
VGRLSGAQGKRGQPPGSLVYIGEARDAAPRVTVYEYDAEGCHRRSDVIDPAELRAPPPGRVLWVNVDGVHDAEIVAAVGEAFDLHPLLLEDVMNTGSRAKAEEFDGALFLVVKMLTWQEAEERLDAEHVSLVLRPGVVITFQERAGDVFDAVRERLASGKGQVRRQGADYLCYALLDALVDQLFVILGAFSERLEGLEEAVLAAPGRETLRRIHGHKRQAVLLRRAIWPLREAVGGLMRADEALITPGLRMYLNDLHDHVIQAVETADGQREMLASLVDLYLSSASHRMNEVMRVLTVIATIFIPLTFIAGIYGMNFETMPELRHPWGYPLCLAAMGGLALGMVAWFRRRGWL